MIPDSKSCTLCIDEEQLWFLMGGLKVFPVENGGSSRSKQDADKVDNLPKTGGLNGDPMRVQMC